MGAAVCYKPRPTTISKDDVLRALNDKHMRETITEPDIQKTFKTDEHQLNMLTFGNLTQQLQIDTHEVQNSSINQFQGTNRRSSHLGQTSGTFGQIELNILTYYGYKEDIYETLANMSRKSLYFMKKNYKNIENQANLKHANERIKFQQVKSIEEHSSGVNQLLRINARELVTVSDDCYLKFWTIQNLKVDTTIATETVTCIAITGSKNKDVLVAGCHSGNLILINTVTKVKKELITGAHYNLIRVIVSLEALKHKYFVTADVCGIIKVWTSSFKPQSVLEIDLEQAISYNSMIEVMDMLPRRSTYDDTAMIVCALKSLKINLILLLPGSGTYQIIKTLKTTLKPTCLIQLSSKHLAIAVGSLKEQSEIEIHDLNKGTIVSRLKHHNDMIDSLLKIQLPSTKTKTANPYITWLISASRDRQIVVWKLIDGKIMKRNYTNLIQSMKKTTQQPVPSVPNKRTFEELKQQKIKKKKDKKQKKRKRNSDGEEEEDDYSNQDDEEEEEEDEEEDEERQDSEEEKQPLIENHVDLIKEVKTRGSETQVSSKMLDYYYVLDSGHKDFIRSMAQLNDNTIVTASEDKTIKIFNIGF